MTKLSKTTFALLTLALCQACAVAPWERGALADDKMALDPYPNVSHIRDHIFTSREAAQGGRSSSGGGCGCN